MLPIPSLLLLHTAAFHSRPAPARLADADSTLTAALRRLPPRELKQCSTASLCNLVWALGKMVSVRAGSEPRSGAPGRRAATTGENRWLQSPAGVEARAVTHAAATELAARQLTAHDVSAVAMALATHSSLTGLLPARAVAIVRGACVAALAADAFTSSELASLAVAAARMRWDDSPLLDGLTRALLPRVSALAQPGDVVRALAGLAPGSAGTLFVSLAHAYIGKMKHQLMHDGHLLPADLDSRSASLAAFSAVGQAQGRADRLSRAGSACSAALHTLHSKIMVVSLCLCQLTCSKPCLSCITHNWR